MTFLSPWSALLLAAIAVPLLLLLYFLKLRRRTQRVASTVLWRSAFEDLYANVPFQRLRWSWLLLLQLLALLLLLLAFAEPVMDATRPPATRMILLVDHSASMQARDAGGDPSRTRLDAALDATRRIIERLGTSSAASRVMIISFAARPQVVCQFEGRRSVLLDALASIAPTDEEADLDAALRLAGAFANTSEDAAEARPEIVLVSDGTVAPAPDEAGFALRSGGFRYVPVRPAPDAAANVGVVSFSARRDPENPARVLVFARLLSTGTARLESVVTLFADGEPVAAKRLELPARTPGDAPPGEATVTFEIDLPGGALLAVRHGTRDPLPADDVAALFLPPPAPPRIALVHGDDSDGPDAYLLELLSESEPASLRVLTRSAWAAFDPAALDRGERYDLVVFDDVSPDRLPGVPTISFGAAPPPVGTVPASAPGARPILSWLRRHPLMRHVSLDAVRFAGFGGFDLPPAATALASGPDGPVIALVATRGAEHVLVGFRLARSNWPLDVSIAIFVQNALDHLTLARTGRVPIVVRPGEPVTVRSAVDAERIEVEGPQAETVRVTPGELVTLPALRRTGVYELRGAEPPHERIAVSMLSDVESDLRPPEGLVVNAQLETGTEAGATAPRDLWPWLVAAAFAALVLEWVMYIRRARL